MFWYGVVNMNKKILAIPLILFLTLATLIFLTFTKKSNSVITTQYTDMNGDKISEKIVVSYKITNKSLDTKLTILEKKQLLWNSVHEEIIESSGEPVPSYQGDATVKLIGFIKTNKGSLVVVQTSRKGSGGFTGYKVYGFKNGKYGVINESLQLNHGNISIENNRIKEITDFPILDDPNCCASYKKYRTISFSDNLNPIVGEFTKPVDSKAQDIFLSLKDQYPYLYSLDNNGQVFNPTTLYQIYEMDKKKTYLALAEYKLPSWSGMSVVVLQESPVGYKELLKIPYSNSRGRWQELEVQNNGRTLKVSGDVGKIGCNGANCRIKWFDYYDYNLEDESYTLANTNYPEAYKELLNEYEVIDETTCVNDSDGKVNDSLIPLLQTRTPADANFCDEQYGTRLIEYNDVANFANAYSVIENIISGKNESYFK